MLGTLDSLDSKSAFLFFKCGLPRVSSEFIEERIEWTYGESNPDPLHAMEVFYRYTIGPNYNGLYPFYFIFEKNKDMILPVLVGWLSGRKRQS